MAAWYRWPAFLACFAAGGVVVLLATPDRAVPVPVPVPVPMEVRGQDQGRGQEQERDQEQDREQEQEQEPEPKLDVLDADAEPEGESPRKLGPAPTYPLPRMPGTQKIRATETPAEDGRGWVLVRSLRVPAKAAQVETFYRKALSDQGLKVSGGPSPTRPDRVYLRGRSRRGHADVTITGKPGRAQTTVRVIWRAFR